MDNAKSAVAKFNVVFRGKRLGIKYDKNTAILGEAKIGTMKLGGK